MSDVPTHVTPEADLWLAVLRRDATYDGAFVYAVRSTGVYCKPSCPSRPARRENVQFFTTGAEAQSAGFRACKRCRPDEDANPHTEAVRQACERIRTADDTPDLGTLARDAGLSPGHFQRIFKAEVGLSPKQFALAERRKRLRDALSQAPTVTQAIYEAGYSVSSRAYADASAIGLEPTIIRNGAKGETIQFAKAHSSLGDLVIAATERGLCFVEFGDPEQLEAELSRRFSGAAINPGDGAFSTLVDQVVALIDAPHANGALPLDIRGTSFQERVLARAYSNPAGSDSELLGARSPNWTAYRRPRRGARLRDQRHRGRCALSPRRSRVRGHQRLQWGVERKHALLERERSAAKERE